MWHQTREKILVLVFLFFFVYAGYGETYVSGDVSGVWEASGSPYYVTGELHVPTDDSLRIMPGCSVIFQGHYKFCVDSSAVLKAIGTETDSIIFTAENTVSGWWGIRFIHSSEACTLEYCRIQYGRALGDEDDIHGGGIYCDHSNPYISKNTITQNLAEWGGGGIYCCYSEPVITGNTISNNSAYWYGGGIYLSDSNPKIFGNKIDSNDVSGGSAEGGGIYLWNSNPEMTNNVIANNIASGENSKGGGICSSSSNPIILNNDIVGNRVMSSGHHSAGGGLYCATSEPVLINSVFSENSASAGNEIYLFFWSTPSRVFISHCNINPEGCFIESGGEIIWGDGNINEDPMFVSPADFHLQSGSPCIDAGAESVYVALWDTTIFAPTIDFEGGIRPWEEGWDIGADEYGTSAIQQHRQGIPKSLLINVYPNPFNSACRISAPPGATVEIFNILGNLVWSHTTAPSGSSETVWTPDKSTGSGVYLVRATAGKQSATRKILYLK